MISEDRYPEPDIGTREEFIKARLKEALRDPARAPITSDRHSATGMELSERFTEKLDVLTALAVAALTERQRAIIARAFGPKDESNDTIAAALGVSRRTVVGEKHAAILAIVRLVFQDPGYIPVRHGAAWYTLVPGGQA